MNNEHSHGQPSGDEQDAGDFARRLDEALDERRSLDDPAWLDAVREDPAGRELLEGYRAMAEGMRQRSQRSEARPSVDLAARVLSQVRAESGQEKKVTVAPSLLVRFKSPMAWLAAAAACLVIVPMYYAIEYSILIANAPPLNSVLKTDGPRHVAPIQMTPAEVAKTDPPAPVTNDPASHANDPALRALVAEAGDRYLELAKETRESFAEVAILLPAAATEPDNAAKKQWIDQVGDGLKPVTRSVGGAFDFLLQAIPIEEPRS